MFRSIHFIVVSPCWLEASELPTVLNMFEDIPQWRPVIKDLIMDVSRPGAQGPAISVINLWAAQKCMLHRQGFSSSVC